MSARCSRCKALVDRRESDKEWVHTSTQRVGCGEEPTKGRPPAVEAIDDTQISDG